MNTAAYTRAAATSTAPWTIRLSGTNGSAASTNAAMTAAGHTAGHTACRSACGTVRPTRRQPAGNSTNIDEMATGISVPSATPGRPRGLTSAMLSGRVATAAATFV